MKMIWLILILVTSYSTGVENVFADPPCQVSFSIGNDLPVGTSAIVNFVDSSHNGQLVSGSTIPIQMNITDGEIVSGSLAGVAFSQDSVAILHAGVSWINFQMVDGNLIATYTPGIYPVGPRQTRILLGAAVQGKCPLIWPQTGKPVNAITLQLGNAGPFQVVRGIIQSQ